MSTYLTTIAELKSAAIGELGNMREGSYADFMAMAQAAAARQGVKRPKLIVGLIYNDQRKNLVGLKETPYPIAESEWDVFVSQIDEYLEAPPTVYVIDGDRYTAPI